jgi:predicted outer membrane repeat protein
MNLNDNGAGSLRAAVANNNGSIDFGALPGVIHLTTGAIPITQNVTIIGNNMVTINGSNRDRIFVVAPCVSVTIRSLTLTDGFARGSTGRGGAILNYGDLIVDSDTFNYDRAWVSGGAIETETSAGCPASLTVYYSSFKGNRAMTEYGGAIATNDPQQPGGNLQVWVFQSTFEANVAALGGGAIDFDPIYSGTGFANQLYVEYSTFQGNEAADGGAIYSSDGASAGSEQIDVLYNIFDSNGANGSLATASGYGGAIAISLGLSGTATAHANILGGDCSRVFTGNWANFGGAISILVWTFENSNSTVKIDQATVSSNQAVWGGGIYTDMYGGSTSQTGVWVTRTTVDDNVATSFPVDTSVFDGRGGGIYAAVQGNNQTLLDFVNDTIAYNSAVTYSAGAGRGDGGGLYLTGYNPNQTAIVSLNSLTVAYNHADNDGGGLYIGNGAFGTTFLPWVRNCAFDLNTSGGSGPDVLGNVISHGWNILSTFNATFNDVTDLKNQGDLKLDTQFSCVGPTMTLKPLVGSSVIANSWFGYLAQFDDPTVDQNGNIRNIWTNCGAYGP